MGGISSVEFSWDHSFGESKEVRLLSFFHADAAAAAVSAARTSTTVGLFWFFIGLHVLVVVT